MQAHLEVKQRHDCAAHQRLLDGLLGHGRLVRRVCSLHDLALPRRRALDPDFARVRTALLLDALQDQVVDPRLCRQRQEIRKTHCHQQVLVAEVHARHQHQERHRDQHPAEASLLIRHAAARGASRHQAEPKRHSSPRGAGRGEKRPRTAAGSRGARNYCSVFVWLTRVVGTALVAHADRVLRDREMKRCRERRDASCGRGASACPTLVRAVPCDGWPPAQRCPDGHKLVQRVHVRRRGGPARHRAPHYRARHVLVPAIILRLHTRVSQAALAALDEGLHPPPWTAA